MVVSFTVVFHSLITIIILKLKLPQNIVVILHPPRTIEVKHVFFLHKYALKFE